jgi:hypothetical protein
MRTKLSLDSATDCRVADEFALSGMPLASMPMSRMPLEWLDAGSWRLPSGKALAEFALQAGFLAPLLFKGEQFPSLRRGSAGEDGDAAIRGKNCGKGSGQ